MDLATTQGEYEVLAKSVNSLYLAAFGDRTAKVIQHLLKYYPKEGSKFPDNFLKESLELFKCGVIDKNQFSHLITCLAKTYFDESGGDLRLQFGKTPPDLRHVNDFNILYEIFTLRDSERNNLMDYPEIVEKLVPFFMELDPDMFARLGSFFPNIPKILYPALNKLDSTQLFSLLKPEQINHMLKNMEPEKMWELFFYREDIINDSLKKLPEEILKDIFLLKDSKGNGMLDYFVNNKSFIGKTPLHYANLIPLLVPLLKNLNDLQFMSLLSIKDKKNKTALDQKENIELLLPLILEKLKEQECVEFLSRKDEASNPFLNTENFKVAHPYLMNFSTDALNKLFSVQYLKGNTLLHNPQIYQLAKPLFSNLNPKIFEIKNEEGLSVKESVVNKPSMSWLTKSKEGINIKSLSEDEYNTQAVQLKTDISALWDTFIFGSEEGEISPAYLENDEKIRSPEDLEKAQKLIKQKLDVMIDKIVNRTQWTGTPPADQKEALLQFYSLMLLKPNLPPKFWPRFN